jgi:hypothetical protein
MRVYPDIKEGSSLNREERTNETAASVTRTVAIGFVFISVFIFFLKILFF